MPSEVSFDSTQTIRQAIFEDWRKQKSLSYHKQNLEKKKLEKEEEDKKLKVRLQLFNLISFVGFYGRWC